MAGIISRGFKAGVKALDREAAFAPSNGLDYGRASATLLQCEECHFSYRYIPIPNPIPSSCAWVGLCSMGCDTEICWMAAE